MPNQTFNMTGRAILLGLIAAAYPVIGNAAPAARVDFAIGDVKAIGPNGQSRPVAKGAQIEQGETISTNKGRAQLRFTDGAYVSLQPESEFRIDQYRFDGKQDGNEKGFFSLVKGGLRTITGLVGRNNKNNYQVTTSVATIGIRGTEYTIQYGKSVTGTVGEGEINVCNGAGCLSVMNGESYYVQNDGAKPVMTNKRTDLPPAPPESPPPEYTDGNEVGGDGIPCAISPPGTPGCAAPPSAVLTGTLVLNSVIGDFCDGACIGTDTEVTVVFDSSGKLTQYASSVPTSVSMGGNDGIVAWGTFLDTSGFSGLAHFVAGTPVPSADLAALGGTSGTYSLLKGGATPVTNFLGETIGTLNNASLIINFGGSASVTGAMDWTINGSPISAASLTGSGSGSNLSVFGNCGGSCQVSGNIALFGPNAVRAGMVYEIRDFNNIEGMGAAAFAKK